jgi:hypothetical protein
MTTTADAHFVRFARALALGATATLVVASGCESSAQTQASNAATTATESSSGNVSAADAGGTSPATETPTTQTAPPSGAIAQGAACATVAQRDERYEGPMVHVCVCSATDAGGPQWQCQTQPARIMGPLPPPELAA